MKQELLGQMSERLGAEHYGRERQESQVEKAGRVVEAELRRRGWTAAAPVTVAWIAARLQMGSVTNVNTLSYHWRQGRK